MSSTKKKLTKKPLKKKHSRKPAKTYVKVTTASYGKALRGTLIYWEGRRPSGLGNDGRISFGKNILEALKAKFERFRWIITEDTNSIKIEYGITRVRTSQRLLSKMSSEQIDRNRDIKNDIIRKFFSIHFTEFFKEDATPVYVPGTLSKNLSPDMIPRLTSRDKEALNTFIPDYVASESLGIVNQLKARAEIDSLKGLAANLAKEIPLGLKVTVEELPQAA